MSQNESERGWALLEDLDGNICESTGSNILLAIIKYILQNRKYA